MPLFDRSSSMGLGGLSEPLKLPHRDFDNGRTTGVKGVIADARSFEEARKTGGWRSKLRGNTVTKEDKRSTFFKDASSGSEAGLSDDEEFLERWRQQRRVEIQNEGKDIRNRRTSPSVRRYGRFDEVDALGYLDAIEKVGRETVVVVFVYDPEVCCSSSHFCTQKHTHKLTVRRLASDSLGPAPARRRQSHSPLRPRPLRRYRIRECGCPRHPRIQEPRRSLRKPYVHHRSDSGRYRLRHKSRQGCSGPASGSLDRFFEKIPPLPRLIRDILRTSPSPVACAALQGRAIKTKFSLHSFRQRWVWVGIDTHVYYKHEHEHEHEHENKGYGHETERHGDGVWMGEKEQTFILCMCVWGWVFLFILFFFISWRWALDVCGSRYLSFPVPGGAVVGWVLAGAF